MKFIRVKRLLILVSVSLFGAACGGGGGACVGESSLGNGLCEDGWAESECDEWDADEINGSSWTFKSGESCEDLGYTYECSDGSYADGPC